MWFLGESKMVKYHIFAGTYLLQPTADIFSLKLAVSVPCKTGLANYQYKKDIFKNLQKIYSRKDFKIPISLL